ncbi:MAG TPA: polysaccharide deacetylase family protein [Rhodospirillaceae bacterium]|nr:polysaccharide deacetylase family protein [Rhodospirillaceae bacterium]
MPIWIFKALRLSQALFLSLLFCALPKFCFAEVITSLATTEKLLALTFDACESKTPAFLDQTISDFLVRRQIPFTIFVSGRFARHNRAALAALAKFEFVEFENHSLDHNNHMERMADEEIRHQVEEADKLLFDITGRHSGVFRFPAGNASPHAVELVEKMGYRVVHWSFASGDPIRDLTADSLTNWVLSQTKPGNILIFHINGRGYATGQALPEIVDRLLQRGYRFTTLERALP